MFRSLVLNSGDKISNWIAFCSNVSRSFSREVKRPWRHPFAASNPMEALVISVAYEVSLIESLPSLGGNYLHHSPMKR